MTEETGRSYIVKDLYESIKEDSPTLELAKNEEPLLIDASYTLIRTFELHNGDPKKAVRPTKVMIEGKFSLEFKEVYKRTAPVRPAGYMNAKEPAIDLEWDPERLLYKNTLFKTTDLLTLPLPTVKIKGKFKHTETKREYHVTIDDAFITQDFPGSFYRQPLERGEYTFIATRADIRPLPLISY